MKKSKRIQPLVRLAEAKEQRAAAELGEAQTQLQAQVNRLKELQNYQNEYLARYQQTGENGVSIHALQSFRSFLDKLKIAIEQQEQVVSQARTLLERRKQQWYASRNNVKMFNNVAGKFVDEEQQQEQKQEQKESDERAQRAGPR